MDFPGSKISVSRRLRRSSAAAFRGSRQDTLGRMLSTPGGNCVRFLPVAALLGTREFHELHLLRLVPADDAASSWRVRAARRSPTLFRPHRSGVTSPAPILSAQ